MKFIIIGSGGCVALPKPLCQCKICKEAREKGKPYSRFGCSLFLDDLKLLVDTPEDIVHALNYSNIQEVNSVLFSHMDPDHVLGMRVFEHMRLNWFEISEGKECINPIDVYAMEQVMEDLNSIGSKHGSYLDYYEKVRNLIKRNSITDCVCLKEIKVTFVKVDSATIFIFEKEGRKVIYAPCDVKPFPQNDIFNNGDVMVIGNTVVGEVLKDEYILSEDNIFRKELFSMNEIVELKNKYKIKKVIMTHLEEDWGKSYDDYLELEKQYDGISFAYDGMTFEV
jgi:phosphoribosyl 1,2-cyclic phosphate phosphodiesterase